MVQNRPLSCFSPLVRFSFALLKLVSFLTFKVAGSVDTLYTRVFSRCCGPFSVPIASITEIESASSWWDSSDEDSQSSNFDSKYEWICSEAEDDYVFDWHGKSYSRSRSRKARPFMSSIDEENKFTRNMANITNNAIANGMLDYEQETSSFVSSKRARRLARRARKHFSSDSLSLRAHRIRGSQVYDDYSREDRQAYYQLLDRERVRKFNKKKARQQRRRTALVQEEYVNGEFKVNDFDYSQYEQLATEALNAPVPEPAFEYDDFEDDIENIEQVWTESNLRSRLRSIKNGFRNKLPSSDGVLPSIAPMWEAFKAYSKITGTTLSDTLDGNEWYAMVGIYILQMMRSTNAVDDLLATTQLYLGTRLAGKSDKLPKEVLLLLMSINYARRVHFKTKEDAIMISTEAADEIDTARIGAASFLSSHFVEALRNIVLILVSYKLFSKDVAKHLHLWLGKVDKPKSIPEAMSKITTSIADLVRMGERLQEGAPLSKIFLSEDPNKTVMKTGRELKASYHLLYYGLPVEGHTCAKVWMKSARETLSVIQFLLKKVNPYDPRTVKLSDLQKELSEQVASVGRLSQRQRRATPYGVVIHGLPGIGKSSILTIINQIWSDVKGRIFDQSHQFERVQSSQYWDGYDPWSHPIIHYSEVGSFQKKIAESGQDTVVKELLGVIDSLPYCVDMSGVNDKGKVFCLAEMVVIDTNNQDLNLPHIVKNAAAFYRRLIFIEPIVKQEYRKGLGGLDATIESEDYMDKWTFNVSKKIPISASQSDTKVILDGTDPQSDIYALERILREDMARHISQEEGVRKKLDGNWLQDQVEVRRRKAAERHPDEPFPKIIELDSVSDEAANSPIVFEDHDDEKGEELLESTQFDNDSFWFNEDWDQSTFDKDEFDRLIDGDWNADPDLGTEAEDIPHVPESWFRRWVLVNPKESSCKCCPGGKHHDNNDIVVCECCPDGIHRESKKSKYVKDVLRHGFHTMTSLPLMLAGGAIDFYNVFRESTAFGKFMILFNYMLMFVLLPWTRKYILYHLMIAGSFYACIYALAFGGSEVKRKLYQRGCDFFTYKYERAMGYIRKDPDGYLRMTTYVVGILAAIKLVTVMYDFYNARNATVFTEADYQTKSDAYTELRKFEDEFNCQPSFTRIKGKLPEMHYDNVRESQICEFTSGNLTEFQNLMNKNIRQARFFDEVRGIWRGVHVLGICGAYVICNKHVMSGQGDVRYEVSRSFKHYDKNGNPIMPFSGIVSRGNIIEVVPDIVMFKVDGQNFTDITKYFPYSPARCENVSGIVEGSSVVVNDMKLKQLHLNDLHSGLVTIEKPKVYSWKLHGKGKCGIPVLGRISQGATIVGIHSGGWEVTSDNAERVHDSFCTEVLRSDIEVALSVCKFQNSGKDGFEPINAASEASVMIGEEPMDRSATRFVEQGPVTLWGRIGLFFGHEKSNYVPAPFAEKLDEVFVDTLEQLPSEPYVPAKMAPSKTGSPITEGFKKLVGVRKPVHDDIMKKSMKQIADKIYNNLIAEGFTQKLQPLDLLTAFNGSVDDYLSKGFTASKAAGFGFPGKKSKWMHRYEKDGKVSYEPKDVLLEAVLAMVKEYERGNCTNPVFKAALKDEIRTLTKYLKSKTRVFYVTPFPFLIIQKMFLGPLYMLMIQYSRAFYTAIGIDMHRHGHFVRSSVISHCLKNNPKANINVLEGDYGGFDTSMPYKIGEGANWIAYDLLKRFGYNSKQMKIVAGIMTDAMFPRLDFWGDLLTVPGLQPSGKYATAEDNSIRNLLIQVYNWNSIPELADKDFFEYVLPCNYGDDVSGGVVDDVADEFNNIVFARLCDSIGLEFTSSTKSKDIEKFVSVRLMSFLKRTFRYHKDLERPVSTLSIDSIYKMLQWYAPSKEVNPEVQMKGICDSAIREAFFWLPDEAKFNKFRDYLLTVLDQTFVGCSFTLPKYWELVSYYKLTPEEEEGLVELNYVAEEDLVMFY